MYKKHHKFFRLFSKSSAFFAACVFFNMFLSTPAHADIVDAFDLSGFVPLVLTSMMNIATLLYNYFVGNGTGLIYTLIFVFLGYYLLLYLVKMHIPKDWLSFLGFDGGGEMWDGSATGWSIAENVMKPCVRAIVAALFLLQIKPADISKWFISPFLEFGSIYTETIFKTVNKSSIETADAPVCPASIKESKWISERSCNFLIRPVYIITQENNRVIRYGFSFIKSGLRGLMTLIPHGGEDLLNIITGFLLVVAFISSNVFMALLIIQAIFDFCFALTLYPINVLVWVAKKSDKWLDILPPFSQIIDSLKKIVITMIACAFILCINLALVKSLFDWSSSVFVVAAGGTASSNLPSITNTSMNFGRHSILWLSAILTLFIMQNIFSQTQKKINDYTKDVSKDLYNDVTNNAKIYWNKAKAAPGIISDLWNAGKKATKK